MLRRIVVILTVLACAVLIVILASQNQSLTRELARTASKVILPYEGLMLPSIRAATLDGDTAVIGEKADGGRQVLLVFTTTCPHCRASIPAFEAISDSLHPHVSSGRVQLLGISLDSLEPTILYRNSNRLSYRIALFRKKDPVVFRALAVPLVLVLDSIGQVTYSRFGGITTRQAVDSVLHAARTEAGSALQRVTVRH
jgi:thiol-disulfide isomerase/thioredoxin